MRRRLLCTTNYVGARVVLHVVRMKRRCVLPYVLSITMHARTPGIIQAPFPRIPSNRQL
jgi:hypothetical protein